MRVVLCEGVAGVVWSVLVCLSVCVLGLCLVVWVRRRVVCALACLVAVLWAGWAWRGLLCVLLAGFGCLLCVWGAVFVCCFCVRASAFGGPSWPHPPLPLFPVPCSLFPVSLSPVPVSLLPFPGRWSLFVAGGLRACPSSCKALSTIPLAIPSCHDQPHITHKQLGGSLAWLRGARRALSGKPWMAPDGARPPVGQFSVSGDVAFRRSFARTGRARPATRPRRWLAQGRAGRGAL